MAANDNLSIRESLELIRKICTTNKIENAFVNPLYIYFHPISNVLDALTQIESIVNHALTSVVEVNDVSNNATESNENKLSSS